MRLQNAARYFDQVVCADAYLPSAMFRAQLDLFDDSKRDGATVERRVLSVDPRETLPLRGAFMTAGDTFVMGAQHQDSYGNNPIRLKFVCHKADGLASLQTLEQAILGTAGIGAYAARLWVKDNKNVVATSVVDSFYNIFLSATESVAVASIVTLDGRVHIVRNTLIAASGFLLCEADELTSNAVSPVVYTDRSGQAYDSSADAVGSLSTVSCNTLWHRFQSGYEYLRASADKFEPGDITANFSKSNIPSPGAGDTFTLLGDTWRVHSVRDNGANVWMLHACRV
jgi:hypothetical protein